MLSLLKSFAGPRKPELPAKGLEEIVRHGSRRELQGWLRDLPAANPIRSAELTMQALAALRGPGHGLEDKLHRLEEIRKVLHYLAPALLTRVTATGFPLHGAARSASGAVAGLHREFFTAYRWLFEQMVLAPGKGFKPETMLKVVHRAMSHLSALTLQSALVYQPLDRVHWRTMYEMYMQARFRDLNKAVFEDALIPISPVSLERLYRSALLFDLAGPQAFSQQQMLWLFRRLGTWSGHTRLVTAREAQGKRFYLLSETGRLSPSLPEDESGPVLITQFAVETDRLVRYLRNRLKKSPGVSATAGKKGAEKRKVLLQHLASAWSRGMERRFQRIPMDTEIEAIPGFDAVIQQISERSTQKQEPAQRLQDLQLIPLDIAGKRARDYKVDHRGQTLWEDVEPEQIEICLSDAWEEVIGRGGNSQGIRLRTLNGSMGGYCLIWEADQSPRARVGQLLGIRDRHNILQTGVGVIRWIKQAPGHAVNVGFEFLTRYIEAVVKVQKTGATTYERCLLGSHSPGKSFTKVLICPPDAFAGGDEVTLYWNHKSMRLRLKPRCASATSAACFLISLPAES